MNCGRYWWNQKLAGVGGTQASAGGHQLRFEKVYASADFASADSLLRQFMADAEAESPADELLLALPGPLRCASVHV